MNACWYRGGWLEGDVLAHKNDFLNSPSLRFGATVFTTMRVYEKDLSHPLTQWNAHCDRLRCSLDCFRWSQPNWQNLRIGCEQMLARSPSVVLRLTIFPDGCEWIAGRALPHNLNEQQQAGISAWIAPASYQRSLPTHKTGNYLASWLAKSQAEAVAAEEAILIGDRAEWLETSTGNLWGWKDGHWWTPKTDRCLPGLMRDWLIARLHAAGEPVGFAPWDAQRVPEFEAIAYSNCVVQFLPIHTIVSGQTKLNYNAQHASIQALQRQIASQTSDFVNPSGSGH